MKGVFFFYLFITVFLSTISTFNFLGHPSSSYHLTHRHIFRDELILLTVANTKRVIVLVPNLKLKTY